MFLAHLPAGYLLTRAVERRRGAPLAGRKLSKLMLAGLIASVIPDTDLAYFYLWGHRQTAHHHYLPHLPLIWVALALFAWAVLCVAGRWDGAIFVTVILANVLMHLLLDSVAAEIYWLWPFSDVGFNLIAVPAGHRWWVWNFLLHWSFRLELAILTAAVLVWRRDRRRALCFAQAPGFITSEG